MPADLKDLTEQALRLPPDERVVLAESLLLTIDESNEMALDDATMQKLHRRLQELRDGTVTGIPVEQALTEVREKLNRRY